MKKILACAIAVILSLGLSGCGVQQNKAANAPKAASSVQDPQATIENEFMRDFYWGESLQEVQEKRKTIFNGHDNKSGSDAYLVALNDDENNNVLGSPFDCYQAWFTSDNKLWSLDYIFSDHSTWTDFQHDQYKFYITNLVGKQPVQEVFIGG